MIEDGNIHTCFIRNISAKKNFSWIILIFHVFSLFSRFLFYFLENFSATRENKFPTEV